MHNTGNFILKFSSKRNRTKPTISLPNLLFPMKVFFSHTNQSRLIGHVFATIRISIYSSSTQSTAEQLLSWVKLKFTLANLCGMKEQLIQSQKTRILALALYLHSYVLSPPSLPMSTNRIRGLFFLIECFLFMVLGVET